MFPLDRFVETLAFDSSQWALKFLDYFHVELDQTDETFINVRDGRQILVSAEEAPSTSEFLPSIPCQWIEQKASGRSLPQVGIQL